MLETSNVLVNKLCMRIVRGDDTSGDLGVGDIVLGMLYKQIGQIFDIIFDWRTFLRGGSFITTDNRVKGNIQTAQTADERTLWAARLSVKDDSYQRRRWIYNMSIVQVTDDEIWFYYAKCFQDHMAGSLKPSREIPRSRDTVPIILFESPLIHCMTGQYSYPRAPIILDDDSIHDIINIILDSERPIPIMLITCPDVVSPETVFDLTIGNLIVACCDDSRLVMELNNMLPQSLYTQWDSIHILMPLSESRAFHPTYTYEDVRRMGIDSFMNGIRQAFCESLRSKEKHAFLTVEDVEKCRNRGRINQLVQTCEAQKAEMDEMRKRLVRQEDEIITGRAHLEEMKGQSKELEEYEEMLDESMKEISNLRNGISELTTRLYSSIGTGFRPNGEESIAILQELSHAIYVAFSCAADKK